MSEISCAGIAAPAWTDPRYLYPYVFWGISGELSKSDDWKLFHYHTIENASPTFHFAAGPADSKLLPFDVMPGRKIDVSDCAWLAQLLDNGMLRPSFIPPREIRELRDLVRYRASFKHDHTRIANRLHKVLQDADLTASP